MSSRIKSAVIAGAVVAALGAGGAAIAGAAGGSAEAGEREDAAGDRPVTGQALDRASAAALAETGGGKVTETEVGDEEGAYEVEVTRADGSQVDLHLDEHFQVLGSVDDREDAGKGDD